MPAPNKILQWDLVVRWSNNPNNPETLDEVPDHIVRDLNNWFDILEEEENKYMENDDE